MSLTLGSGPFSPDTTGRFDAGVRHGRHTVFVQPVDRRVRGWLGGCVVVDTRRAQMVHESGGLPTWWLPLDDVDTDLLHRSDDTADDPKGRLRRHELRLDGREVQGAATTLEEPADGVPDLSGLVAIEFAALDRWQQEDDEVVGRPRDPYHRVDMRRASEHVVVRVGGRQVAQSRRPVELFETGMPVRWYLPREDVEQTVLSPSLTRTVCPYKGVASYSSVTVGGTVVEDAAWCYPDPLGEALQVRDHLSFLGEGVEVTVDGERVP